MTPKGLLFDIDGTMTDSDPAHFASFNAVISAHRAPITLQEYHTHIHGLAEEDAEAWLFPDPATRPNGIVTAKEEHFRANVTTMEAIPGLLDILDLAEASGLPFAAVTNAPRENAEVMLRALGVRDRMAALICGMELAQPKPHPLPFLEGARAIGRDPDACIAFEDSLTGIASAHAAGCTTFAIAAPIPAESQLAAGAVAVVEDFTDPRIRARLAAAA